MIAAKSYLGKKVAVMGLARSGQSAAEALKAGGAEVIAWDDDVKKCKETALLGINISDLTKEDFTNIDALILSPGIPHSYPKPHVVAKKAKKANTPIIGDIEIFVKNFIEPRIIGITGTNGKSTTTALVGHILRCAGLPVEIGGNIGLPVLGFENTLDAGYQVLELSSYQLELTPSLCCEIAVILNISPDHLDRHGGMDGYKAAKLKIMESLPENAIAIIGVDDPESIGIAKWLIENEYKNLRVIPISGLIVPESGVGVLNGNIVSNINRENEVVISLHDNTILPGVHNWQNVAAGTAVALTLGLSNNIIKNAISSFPGLPHRQELVGTFNRLTFINDSKATNADATARALSCYESIYWILGGQSKEGGIGLLRKFFPKIRHAFLIGECSEEFADVLKGVVKFTNCGTIQNAIEAIKNDIPSIYNDKVVILLSPAAASFDQFESYEARGDAFRLLIEEKILNNPGLRSCLS